LQTEREAGTPYFFRITALRLLDSIGLLSSGSMG
jgi:hypothetical protein